MHDKTQVASRFLKTSLQPLDLALRGGVLAGTVTEITGPSGCGKTQFCTMMTALVALPAAYNGSGGAVLYIDTEGAFSAKRLLEIVESKCPATASGLIDIAETVGRVHVMVENTCASLLTRLKNLEEAVIRTGARLVVVDSIASLVRKEFDNKSLSKQVDLLSMEAALLKYIAEVFAIPVIVTNQVTTRGDSFASHAEMGNYITAALGNTWAHSVNTRLVIEYSAVASQRVITIRKSPLAVGGGCSYVIRPEGLVAVAEVSGPRSDELAKVVVRSTCLANEVAGRSDAQHTIILQQLQQWIND